jgi:hypothetical protein
MEYHSMDHKFHFLTKRFVLGLTVLLFLLLSCTGEDPSGPSSDDPATSLIRFMNCRIDTIVLQGSEITLRWSVDSIHAPAKRIVFWVKDAYAPGWLYQETLDRLARSRSVQMGGFGVTHLRFGIGFEGGPVLDSSGVIEQTEVTLRIRAPLFRTSFHRDGPKVFRWRCEPSAAPGQHLVVDCARYGDNWQSVASVPASQDSLVLDRLPVNDITWLRFRFRLEQSSKEIITDSVAQLRIFIKGLQAGDVIERGKPLDVELEAAMPSISGITAPNVLTLSTDGGVTWAPVAANEYLVQPASDRCFLRYANAYFGVDHTVGPFRIVDRTTPFFTLQVGMRLTYLYEYSVVQGGVQVRADTTWMTVEVRSEEVLGNRTIYHCAITNRVSAKDSTTSQGTLTRKHDGLQEIAGSFAPFATFAFPSLLHPDITVLKYSKVIGQPGTIGVQGKRMDVHRDRGVTSYSENTVTGIISKSGYGFSYILQ